MDSKAESANGSELGIAAAGAAGTNEAVDSDAADASDARATGDREAIRAATIATEK
jgi:hypothetical protein